MITSEEVQDYYNKHYPNKKIGIELNINKNLHIDIKIMCAEMSKKLPYKMTPSSLTRSLWTRYLMENKK